MSSKRAELVEKAVALPGLQADAARAPIVAKADGARLYDVDNAGLLDFTGAAGVALVGFTNGYVTDAVKRVSSAGLPAGMHSAQEVDLANDLVDFYGWADRWSLLSSGEAAIEHALALARRTSGRRRVLWIDGADGRGHLDSWSIEAIEEAIRLLEPGAVVVDPFFSKLGLVPAPAGRLAAIVESCHRAGAVVICDERVSGLRLGRGGASAWADFSPDLAVFGPSLSAGLPFGAVAIRTGLAIDLLFSAALPHPISLAAATAVLSIVRNETIFEHLDDRSEQLQHGLSELAERFSRPLQVERVRSMLGLYFSAEAVVDRSAAVASDGRAYEAFADELRAEGIYFPPSPMVPIFLSKAHAAKDVDEALGVVEKVWLKQFQDGLP